MDNFLYALEEFDTIRKITFPHLLYDEMTPENKRNVAFMILGRKAEEILLVSPLAFGESYIVAGMTEQQIAYFSLHATRDYRESLMRAFSNQESITDMMQIATTMDQEIGKGSIVNQQRLRKVFNYLRDNQIVFKF